MKSLRKIFRMPKEAVWLLPGLEVKRWFLFLIAGTIVATIGLCILMDLKPIYNLLTLTMKVGSSGFIPSSLIGIVFIKFL